MKMLDEVSDKKIENLSLFFTTSELKQLLSYLQELLSLPQNSHIHMSSPDYQKEITICKYDPQNLTLLHERAKKLITEDK